MRRIKYGPDEVNDETILFFCLHVEIQIRCTKKMRSGLCFATLADAFLLVEAFLSGVSYVNMM